MLLKHLLQLGHFVLVKLALFDHFDDNYAVVLLLHPMSMLKVAKTRILDKKSVFETGTILEGKQNLRQTHENNT